MRRQSVPGYIIMISSLEARLQYRVRALLGEIDTQAPPPMEDELARAVLASYFSHN